MLAGAILISRPEGALLLLLMLSQVFSLLLSMFSKIITTMDLQKECNLYFHLICYLGIKEWGILETIKELKSQRIKITKIIHDKDSSTMANVMNVYEDVVICVKMPKFLMNQQK